MNRRNRLAPLVILVALALTPHLAQASASQKRPLSLDDLAKVRSVNDPQLSPDGKWVAYTVGTVDAEKDKRNTDVWMTSWDGQTTIRLTSTPTESEHSPQWSPDGRWLSFLSSRGDSAGGVLGVATGLGLARLLHVYVPALPVQTPIEYVFLALALSLPVGIACGLFPARKASSLDPVVALAAE